MKRDKNLQNIADDSMERLRDGELHDRLMAEYDACDARKYNAAKKKKLAALCSAISIVAILAILIPCTVWLFNGKDKKNDVYYGYNDEIGAVASLDDVNAALTGFSIAPDYVTYVSLTKDSKSGDDLYYVVEMQGDGFATCRIDLVVNPRYDYVELTTEESFEALGLQIDCRRVSVFEEEYGVYTHTVYAETVIGDVRVYFNVYDTFSEDEDDGFEVFLQSVLIRE